MAGAASFGRTQGRVVLVLTPMWAGVSLATGTVTLIGAVGVQTPAHPDFGEILTWILSLPRPVKSVYEAGPTGFGLARLLRPGQVTAVTFPAAEQEAARDLVHAREGRPGPAARSLA